MRSSARFSRCLAAFRGLALAGALIVAACGTGNDGLTCPAGQRASGDVCICENTGKIAVRGLCPSPDSATIPFLLSNLVDSAGNTGIGLSMVLDGLDYPHLSYWEANNGDLRYATLSQQTGKWAVVTVDREGIVGKFSSVGLIDPAGEARPVIVYYDENNRSLKGAVRSIGGEWKTRFLDPIESLPIDNKGTYNSMVVENLYGADGKLKGSVAHIAYIDALNHDVVYLRWDLLSGEVGLPRLVDRGFTNIDGREYGSGIIDEHTSIALQKDGSPVIAYRDVDLGDLKVARYDPGGDRWLTQFVDNDPLTGLNYEDVGRHSSIAVDDLNNLHVTYYNVGSPSVRYAHFDGSDWTLQTVDSGSVGAFTSLALAPDRTPFVAYYDASRGDARIAHRRRDGTWQKERVATEGSTGWYVRLALTSSGIPAIAYREFFNQRTHFDYVVWPDF
jgi:hypothetical protein